MWESVDFGKYLVNSLIICTASASAGHGVRRRAPATRWRALPFRGSGRSALAVVGTQLVPGSMFLLPVFLGFIWLKQNTPIHLFDTHLGMILVYTAFFTPVAIWFMRYFFLAIPPELEEAAMVDGCTRFGAFWRVVLPSAAPGLVATFVYAFLLAWDELLFVTALTPAEPRRSRSASTTSSATTARSTHSSWLPASSPRSPSCSPSSPPSGGSSRA